MTVEEFKTEYNRLLKEERSICEQRNRLKENYIHSLPFKIGDKFLYEGQEGWIIEIDTGFSLD